MAGVKKPTRKQQPTSPNVVLVVFLVVFVLSTLILGIWLYYSTQEKDKLAADAKSAKKSSDAAAQTIDLYKALADEARIAVEGPQAVTEDEKKFVGLIREELVKEGGKFGQEKNAEAYKKLLNTYRTDLAY